MSRYTMVQLSAKIRKTRYGIDSLVNLAAEPHTCGEGQSKIRDRHILLTIVLSDLID